MDSTQSKIVELATEKGYNELNHLWFDNNILNPLDWFLECCKLQKWLRETYNTDVIPLFINHNNYGISIFKNNIEVFFIKITMNWSYEESLEVGLQEALKLIK
jgi:hypothetical protein